MNPKSDGKDHINVYSKGQTELGRFLSNFTQSPIETEDGPFESIEGYWYFLLTDDYHGNRERLRTLHGYEAKKVGRDIVDRDWPYQFEVAQFRRKISAAIVNKMRRNPKYLKLLKQTDLPLAHYYVYGSKVITVRGCGWLLDTIDWCRNNL